ncbi:sel1 repeat family protein [archaeon]|nr:MAG: sel1 repeat family protein [archaeon]
MYYYGAGIPTNYTKAAEIFAALYAKGDENAAYLLGYMTVYGQGVLRDVDRGKEMLVYAALRGVMGAQDVLHQLG